MKANDVKALAEAIIKMADNKDLYDRYKNNIPEVAEQFHWEKVLQPVIDFCRDPVSSAVRKNLRPDQIHASTDVLGIIRGQPETFFRKRKRSRYRACNKKIFLSSFQERSKKDDADLFKLFKGQLMLYG